MHSEVFDVKISLVNWYITFISKAKPISETIVIIKQLYYFALFVHSKIFNFLGRNVISVYSSWTGGAGIFGALSYAGLTSADLSPRKTLLVITMVPTLMFIRLCIT